MPRKDHNKAARMAGLRKFIDSDLERWGRIHRTPARREAAKLKWKDHGPRTYALRSESIQTAQTSTLGVAQGQALRTQLRYESQKGKLIFRRYKQKEIPYRNDWDLKAFKSLDENPTIESWTFLSRALPYPDPKRLIPRFIAIDFEVTYRDGRKKMILMRPAGVPGKLIPTLRALENYCEKEKIEFEVWTAEYFNSAL